MAIHGLRNSLAEEIAGRQCGLGGWDEETERGRDTKSSLGGQEKKQNKTKNKKRQKILI